MELWQLRQMQSLPLEVKLRKTKLRIHEWYEHYDGQVYVSFSGGKDSTVLLDIVRSLYPDIPALYVDTGLEYPEIKDFVKTKENVDIRRPEMSFLEVIEKYGYPVISKRVAECVAQAKPGNALWERLHGTDLMKDGKKSLYNCAKYQYLLNAPFKVSNACCRIMKIKPINKYKKETGRKATLGISADESKNREISYLQYGCNAFDAKDPVSKPLGFWTEQDILHYIQAKNLPVCSVYGNLYHPNLFSDELKFSECQRTGCMFCMFGVHLEKEPNRFQLMKQTHPQIYKYCMEILRLNEILDFINVKY